MPNAVPIIILASLMLWPSTGRSQCPPEGYTIEMLLELKANGFQLEPAGTRDQLDVGGQGATQASHRDGSFVAATHVHDPDLAV